MLTGLGLFASSLAWNFSTRRYLTGFADAIIPLAGSPEEKTEALADWFQHEPGRMAVSDIDSAGMLSYRDPVKIVRNARLLKICGSASNAFMNLADAAGLKVRRLLLLGPSGGVMHVVAEVQWGDRWVVVNPQQGLLFKDRFGHALTKEELRDPAVFRDAISHMPGYSPQYRFDHTIYIRLERIPLFGKYLRRVLNRFAPGWEQAINWSYFMENPSLWLLLSSLVILLIAMVANLIVSHYSRNRFRAEIRNARTTRE